MTDPVFGTDLGRVEQEVGRLAEEAATRADALHAVSRQVSAISITEASRDGVVRVTVDATGAVTNLEISDRSRELPGAVLASKVLTTMRTAQARISGRVADIVAESGIHDPATASALVSSYEQRFPEPQPPWANQVRPSAAPSRPKRADQNDDDEWDAAVTE